MWIQPPVAEGGIQAVADTGHEDTNHDQQTHPHCDVKSAQGKHCPLFALRFITTTFKGPLHPDKKSLLIQTL